MATLLTNADLVKAAQQLGCAVAVIRAVDAVESSGKGFDAAGNLILRFETAVFKRYTGTSITGSGVAAYNSAARQNPRAALLSTSWGRYQIMGFNYQVCGFDSVEAFVADLKTGEIRHLAAFVAFCRKTTYKNVTLAVYLQRLDFDSFKNGYNGTGINTYASKMRTAYEAYRSTSPGLDTDLVVTVEKKKPTPSILCSGLCVSPCSAPVSGSTTPSSGGPSGS